MRGVTGLSGVWRVRRGFLLTRPMRGVTLFKYTMIKAITISTHTPHAGRDCLA